MSVVAQTSVEAATCSTRAGGTDQAPSRPLGFAHLPSLDGLRGLAVLAVVAYHFAPGVAPGGFLGVDLFFVLSGFLITSLLVSEWDATRRISLRSFWARRARRLLPALVVVLTAVGLSTYFLPNPVDAQHAAVDGLSALLYVANWHFIGSGQTYIQQFLHQAQSPLRHTWSLAIEEQFYLVWPLLVVVLSKLVGRRPATPERARRRFRWMLVAVCLTLGVASFARMLMLYRPGGDPSRVYYGTDARVFIILIGAALGALTAGVPVVTRRARGPLVFLGCCGAIGLAAGMAAVTPAMSWLYQGGYCAIGLLMVLVLAAAAQPGINPLRRLLSARPLVQLGLISYGVYLWHWPITLWVTASNTGLDGVGLFVARTTLTLGVATVSYLLIEEPIRSRTLARLHPSRWAALAVLPATALLVVLIVPALAFSSTPSAPAAPAPAGVAAVTLQYATAPRCDGGPLPTPIDAHHRVTVQLEGNSIAGEIRGCLGTVLRLRGGRLEGVNPPGFLLCHEIPAIRDQVQATRPDAAILFAFVAYDPRCGPPWHWPVDQLVAIWKAAGTHVYLVPSVPFVQGTKEQQELSVGPLEEALYYRQLADQDPAHVTVVDAGLFLRGVDGQYAWRMPCVAAEPGCDAQGTVGVRYIDGFHYCTDPYFSARGCAGVENQAGERRAAAAVATGLLPSVHAATIGRSSLGLIPGLRPSTAASTHRPATAPPRIVGR